MTLAPVPEPSLKGEAGLQQLRALQADMAKALARQDFDRVRQLDETAAVVLDKLIASNPMDKRLVVNALCDLKSVYADMIVQCRRYSAVSSA